MDRWEGILFFGIWAVFLLLRVMLVSNNWVLHSLIFFFLSWFFPFDSWNGFLESERIDLFICEIFVLGSVLCLAWITQNNAIDDNLLLVKLSSTLFFLYQKKGYLQICQSFKGSSLIYPHTCLWLHVFLGAFLLRYELGNPETRRKPRKEPATTT